MNKDRIRIEKTLDSQFQVICREIDQLLQSGEAPVLVAVDGACASGKTTLGAMLARRYDCNLFHMDDFFLRPVKRTPERLAEVGGNVDYERFRNEVLQPVLRREAFSYQAYDCGTQQLKPEVKVPVKRLNIVEGSYSRHPHFGDCYHLVYCLFVGEIEQQKRILERNGPELLERFVKEWIPKENAYFDKFGMYERGDKNAADQCTD